MQKKGPFSRPVLLRVVGALLGPVGYLIVLLIVMNGGREGGVQKSGNLAKIRKVELFYNPKFGPKKSEGSLNGLH